MPPTSLAIGEARDHIDKRVMVRGWLNRVRHSKGVYRLEVRDRSGVIDAVWEPNGDRSDPSPESVVRLIGTLSESGGNSVRLQVEDLEIVALAQAPPPKGQSSGAQSLDRHLELRSPTKHLIFAVQTTLEAAMREFALSRGFIEIHSPKISGGGSESGATVFSVPYFGESAYLVQSPQFYMQMAMAAGFERAFEIGPVFRSEPGTTPVHATEFTIAHFEMSWIDSHEDLMDFEEALLRYAVEAVAAEHGEEIERLCGVSADFPSAQIPRLPISEAHGSAGEQSPDEAELLLDRLERALSKQAHREHGHGLVFLTDYPADARPFYTMQAEEAHGTGPLTSRSFDLLWHGIEITSGGQREHRFERLERQIAEGGLAEEADRYIRPHFLEMFRYGCPPHGGFGVGINRLLMALLGQPSIKETSFVFRGPKRFMP